MRRWIWRVMAVWCAACGASAPAPIAIDDYAAQLSQATCEFQVRCGGAPDLAACQSILGVAHASATYLAAVSTGRVHYDGGLARECADALGSRSCDVTSASYRGYPEVCLEVVRGTVHGGAACTDDVECISQSCARPSCDMACCAGTCQGDDPPVLAKLGESCAINLCEAEAFCDSRSTTCAPLRRLGDACDPDDAFSCADGLYCLRSSNSCGSLPGLGEHCTDDGCRDRDARCSPITGTCLMEGLEGAPCTVGEDDCAELYVCGADQQCSAGIALGEPCMMLSRCAGAGAFCDLPDSATVGVCTAPRADGGSCRTNSRCASDVCDPASNTCVADRVCD